MTSSSSPPPQKLLLKQLQTRFSIAKTCELTTTTWKAEATTTPSHHLLLDALAALLQDRLYTRNTFWKVLAQRIERVEYAAACPTAKIGFLEFKHNLISAEWRHTHAKRLSEHPLLLRHAAELLNVNLVCINNTTTTTTTTTTNTSLHYFTTYSAGVLFMVAQEGSNNITIVGSNKHNNVTIPLDAIHQEDFCARILKHKDGLDMYYRSSPPPPPPPSLSPLSS